MFDVFLSRIHRGFRGLIFPKRNYRHAVCVYIYMLVYLVIVKQNNGEMIPPNVLSRIEANNAMF